MIAANSDSPATHANRLRHFDFIRLSFITYNFSPLQILQNEINVEFRNETFKVRRNGGIYSKNDIFFSEMVVCGFSEFVCG